MMFKVLGKILTGGKVEDLKKKLEWANIKVDPFSFVGKSFILCLLISLPLSIFLLKYNVFYSILGAIGFVLIYDNLLNSILLLIADQRAKYIENVLPDALLLMASNLRSGVSPEEAFVLSARPEFGLLAEKIKDASKKLASGVDMEEALLELPKGIRSKLFRQTINLIIEGIRSGGEIATLLEETSNNIRDMASLRKEISSMIFVYALFIFMAGCLIAPVLYAVSIQLAGVLSRLSQSIAVQFLTEKAPVKISPTGLSEIFLTNFAYINLIITASFTSLIVALINKGNERYGLRYIPFFLGIALFLFYISRSVLKIFFSGIRVI